MSETMLLITPADMALTVIAAVACGILLGVAIRWNREDRCCRQYDRARVRLSRVCGEAVADAERTRKARFDAVTAEAALDDEA